jgi:hypothetical protein
MKLCASFLIRVLLLLLSVVPAVDAQDIEKCKATDYFNAESYLGINALLSYTSLKSFHCEDMCTNICTKQQGFEFSEAAHVEEDQLGCHCRCINFSACAAGNSITPAPQTSCAYVKTQQECSAFPLCVWNPKAGCQTLSLPLVRTFSEITLDGGLVCRADVTPPAMSGRPYSDLSLIETVKFSLASDNNQTTQQDYTPLDPPVLNSKGTFSYTLTLPPTAAEKIEHPVCKAKLFAPRQQSSLVNTTASACQCPKHFITLLKGYNKSSIFNLIDSASKTLNVCDGCGRPYLKGMDSESFERSFLTNPPEVLTLDDTQGAPLLVSSQYSGYAPITACLNAARVSGETVATDVLQYEHTEVAAFDDAQKKAGVVEYYYTMAQLSYAKVMWQEELSGIDSMLMAINSGVSPYIDMLINDITLARSINYYRELYNKAVYDARKPGTWMVRALNQYMANGTIPTDGEQLFTQQLFRSLCQADAVGAANPTCSRTKIVEGLIMMRDLYSSLIDTTLAPYPWLELDRPSPRELPLLLIGKGAVTREAVINRMKHVVVPDLLKRKNKLSSLYDKVSIFERYLACPSDGDETRIGDFSDFIRELPEVPVSPPGGGASGKPASQLYKFQLELAYLWDLVRERRDAKRETVDVANQAIVQATVQIAQIVFFQPAVLGKLGIATLGMAARARAMISASKIKGVGWASGKLQGLQGYLGEIRAAERIGNGLKTLNLVLLPQQVGLGLTGLGTIAFGYCDDFATVPSVYLSCRSSATAAIAGGLLIFIGPGKNKGTPEPAPVMFGGAVIPNFTDAIRKRLNDVVFNAGKVSSALTRDFWKIFSSKNKLATTIWLNPSDLLAQRPPPIDVSKWNVTVSTPRDLANSSLAQKITWSKVLDLDLGIRADRGVQQVRVEFYYHTYKNGQGAANWGITATDVRTRATYKAVLAECKVLTKQGDDLLKRLRDRIAYDEPGLGIIYNKVGLPEQYLNGAIGSFKDTENIGQLVQWVPYGRYETAIETSITKLMNKNVPPSTADELADFSLWERAHWKHSADLN